MNGSISTWKSRRWQRSNPNYVAEYELSVDAKEKQLIAGIERLVKTTKNALVKKRKKRGIRERNFSRRGCRLSLLAPGFHAYIPLLHVSATKAVQVSPLALNEEEAGFVRQLSDLAGKHRPFFFCETKSST